MTAPVGLIDVEDEAEYVEIAGSPLAEITCDRCGAVQVILPLTHVPEVWCGECRPAMVAFPSPDRDLYPVLAGPPAPLPQEVVTVTYGPEPAGKAVRVDEDHPYPAPLVTSRDDWDRQGVPLAVAKQAQKAVRAGWLVKVQRSVGSLPHATHGTPGDPKTLHAVIVTKDGSSAYAVHDGAKWSSVVTWGVGAPWFAGLASITDFGEYLAGDGRMPKTWYDTIRRRQAGKELKSKTRDACNVGRHEGASLAAGSWTCPLCGNSWPAKAAAWRKPKSTKKDTAQ